LKKGCIASSSCVKFTVIAFSLSLLASNLAGTTAHFSYAQAPGLSITFSNVIDGQTLSGIYKVVVKASDISKVSNIKLYVDTTFIKTEKYDPYEFNTDTKLFTNGAHILKAVATDKSGNTAAATALLNVNIQNGSPPQAPGTYNAKNLFETERLAVPHSVAHFILINPTHSHHDSNSAWIAPTNGLYLPTNLVISQSTSVTLLVWDDHGTHQIQATRDDNGAVEWTTAALSDKQYSTPHLFSATTKYNLQDIYAAPGYSYEQSHIKGTLTIETPTATPDGTISGAIYVPQTFDRSKITGKGFVIESEYHFYKVWKHLPYENTLIIYSSTQPLSTVLTNLQTLIAEVNYD